MKFERLLASAAVFAAAAARSDISPQSPIQALAPVDIPGSSPVKLCDKRDVSEFLLDITKLNVIPEAPKAGESLSIEAVGSLKDVIAEGAYVKLTVKYGLIKLLTRNEDLCDQVKNVDMECPLDKGEVLIKKIVDLPKEIPPGKYTVEADAYTEDGRPITCLTATITFTIGGKSRTFGL